MDKKMNTKEERIRAITKMYYSNPRVQEFILKFSLDREVVPRYFEGFGKRPDTLQYSSDVMGAVNKGATSFHASEELWENILELNLDLGEEEINKLRKGWDLLIDVDSPFLDCSKIATKLIVSALEQHGVRNYGIKFSGSKGFHIIVSGKAFPEEYGGEKRGENFPEWPRAICQYLMSYIRKDYNAQVGDILTNFEAIKTRTKLEKKDLIEVYCINCNRVAKKGTIASFKCGICGSESEKRNVKLTKRRLRCLNSDCAGILDLVEEREYHYCENCHDSGSEKLLLNSEKYPENFEEVKGVSAEKIASLDLVLVAPRHLFRMPYSLHEKTALASIVLGKEEIDSFFPKDADPLKVKIREYYPENEPEEARQLLISALDWKKTQIGQEERIEKKKYKEYKDVKLEGVTEDMFPKPIKKLLKGLEEGRKRGLFVLLTFLRSLDFSGDYINNKIREWNKKNKDPLKEGYVRGQIDWHLKQKRKILPPNYSNDAFWKDLGLLDEKPKEKNPLVEVARKARRRND
tara:strand:- start:3970 stop:5526 length:1557 start_codon:yes stop_codon:yes gene_type:complete